MQKAILAFFSPLGVEFNGKLAKGCCRLTTNKKEFEMFLNHKVSPKMTLINHIKMKNK